MGVLGNACCRYKELQPKTAPLVIWSQWVLAPWSCVCVAPWDVCNEPRRNRSVSSAGISASTRPPTEPPTPSHPSPEHRQKIASRSQKHCKCIANDHHQIVTHYRHIIEFNPQSFHKQMSVVTLTHIVASSGLSQGAQTCGAQTIAHHYRRFRLHVRDVLNGRKYRQLASSVWGVMFVLIFINKN